MLSAKTPQHFGMGQVLMAKCYIVSPATLNPRHSHEFNLYANRSIHTNSLPNLANDTTQHYHSQMNNKRINACVVCVCVLCAKIIKLTDRNVVCCCCLLSWYHCDISLSHSLTLSRNFFLYSVIIITKKLFISKMCHVDNDTATKNPKYWCHQSDDIAVCPMPSAGVARLSENARCTQSISPFILCRTAALPSAVKQKMRAFLMWP